MVKWTTKVKLVTYAKRIIGRTIKIILLGSLIIGFLATINAALKP